MKVLHTLVLTCSIIWGSNANLQAQRIRNLVANPSFEELVNDTCLRVGLNGVKALEAWRISPFWSYNSQGVLRPRGSGDVFSMDFCGIDTNAKAPNTIRGHQLPRTGNQYAGFSWASNRTSLTGQLIEPLVKGVNYTVELHLSLAEAASSQYTRHFQVLFHRDSVLLELPYDLTPGSIQHLPQWYYDSIQPVHIETDYLVDTIGWIKLKGQFTANDSDIFFTLGNFTDVIHNDYRLLPGVVFGEKRRVYYFVDDVAVYASSDTLAPQEPAIDWSVHHYPNPTTSDRFSLAFSLPDPGSIQVRITDVLGKLVWEQSNIPFEKGHHQIDIDGTGWASGQYHISVRYDNAGRVLYRHLKQLLIR